MRAIERLLQIEALLAQEVARIVPLELDGETLRLIVYENYPHHKHVGRQGTLQPSFETSLEEVFPVVLLQGK
jgi:hypothetical protein